MAVIKNCPLCQSRKDKGVYCGVRWRVLLVDDVDYPGFCRVVWNDHVPEVTDLSVEERSELMAAVWTVETCVREVMQPDKINIASLGNQVPHLHWHVIPRYENDKHFPDSVWSVARRPTDEKTTGLRRGRVTDLERRLRATLIEQYGNQELTLLCPN